MKVGRKVISCLLSFALAAGMICTNVSAESDMVFREDTADILEMDEVATKTVDNIDSLVQTSDTENSVFTNLEAYPEPEIISAKEGEEYLRKWNEQKTCAPVPTDYAPKSKYESGYKYFYNFLNNDEKRLYDDILAEFESFYWSDEEPILSANGQTARFGSIEIDESVISWDRTWQIFNMFGDDNRKYFFKYELGTFWESESKFTIYFIPPYEFRTRAAINEYRDEIERLTNIWVPELLKINEILLREEAAYGIVLDHILEYGYEDRIFDDGSIRYNDLGETIKTHNNQNIAGAIVDRICVCAGYASAVSYLFNAAGIDCIYIVSNDHAFNIVKMYGKWYWLDTTWIDRNNGIQKDSELVDKSDCGVNKSYETFNQSGKIGSRVYSNQYVHEWGVTIPEAKDDIITDSSRSCKITFSCEDTDIPVQNTAWGNIPQKPDDPIRNGYRFDGWFSDENYIEPFLFNDYLYSDITLYAAWTKPKVENNDFTIEDGVITEYKGQGGVITIPADVKDIRRSVLNWGADITSVKVDKENKFFTSIDGVLFTKNRKTLVYYPVAASAKEYTIPSGTLAIGRCAFENNRYLKNVILPNGLKRIEECAFSSSKKLDSPIIPDTVEFIGWGAFGSAKGLVSPITIPKSVINMEYAIFGDSDYLTEVTISAPTKDLVMFSNWSFKGCKSLKKIVVPKTFRFGETELSDCDSLTDIYFMGNESQWRNLENDSVFIPNKCKVHFVESELKSISFTLPTKRVYNIGEKPDLTGGRIVLQYVDKSTKGMVITKDMISGFDTSTFGVHTVTITYLNSSINYNISVIDNSEMGVKSITLTPPIKFEYSIGELLDVTGGKITLLYDDGSTKVVDLTAEMCSKYDIFTPGTYTVTVTFGGFTDTFSIIVKYNSDPTKTFVVTVITDQTYTGTALTPALTVKDGTKTLTSGTDYTVAYSNNIEPGTATAVVTGIGDYAGISKVVTFKIVKAPDPIKTFTVADIPDQTYTGKAIMPTLTVTVGTKTLVKGTDYIVSFAENIEVGTATAVVTGIGDYEGISKVVTFKIVKAPDPIKTFTVADIPDQTYTGKAISPTLTVTDGTKTLVKGTDYIVTFADNIEVGTATAVVTGIGDYAGISKVVTFKIVEDPDPKPVITDKVVVNDGKKDTGFDDLLTAMKSISTGKGSYVITITEDLTETKSITMPKNATALTIEAPEAVTVTLKNTSLTSKCDLTLENVVLVTPKGKDIGITAKKKLEMIGSTVGALNVTETLTTNDSVINGKITVKGAAELTDTTVTGKITATSDLTLTDCPTVGAIAAKGILTITGDGTSTGAISVTGKTGETLLEKVTARGNISAANDLVLVNCTAKGNITSKAKLSVEGEVAASGNISAAELSSQDDDSVLSYKALSVTKSGFTGDSSITLRVIDKYGDAVKMTAGDKKAIAAKTFKGAFDDELVLISPDNCSNGKLSRVGNKLMLVA